MDWIGLEEEVWMWRLEVGWCPNGEIGIRASVDVDVDDIIIVIPVAMGMTLHHEDTAVRLARTILVFVQERELTYYLFMR